MLICGRQSIVEVVTSDRIPAEDGPSEAVDFTIRVETYGFVATRRVFIEQREARTFVSHLRAIAQVGQAAATLTATPPSDFQLRIGFIGDTGRALASGRLSATDAGEHAPALEFGFEFDPATLPTIIAECERWIAPPRPAFYLCKFNELVDGMDDGRAGEQFTLLASILDKLGYELASGPATRIDELWALKKEWPDASEAENGAPTPCDVRAERAGVFERQFLAWMHIRLGVLPKPAPESPGHWTLDYDRPDGQIRVQLKSAALFQPFTDQTDQT